jgi:hypothetical protein
MLGAECRCAFVCFTLMWGEDGVEAFEEYVEKIRAFVVYNGSCAVLGPINR